MSFLNTLMNRDSARRVLATLLALTILGGLPASQLSANEIETYAFEKVWWRTDQPVLMDFADRTWIWGPEPITSLLLEPYDEGYASSMEGVRWVQYFDKTRVEITRSDGERDKDWYVTNGLLARELITGRMQLGDTNSIQYEPADINVAGDFDDQTAPTYRSLSHVLDAAPLPRDSTITQTLNRDGSIGNRTEHAGYGVRALTPVDQTGRTIASVFWAFMNAEGTIYDGFNYVEGRLFENPFFATGLPVTEPYWTTVRVGGTPRDVLVQAFERRVLTYTPANPEGWQVEAANVGRHYYRWRYEGSGGPALQVDSVTATRDLSDNLILLGEVTNNARASYGEVELQATIRDETGEPIEQFKTFLDSALIQPSERLPFQIWTEYTGDYSEYEIAVRSRPSHRFYRPDVSVASIHADWVSAHRFEIDGIVRNASQNPVEYLQFVVALYNEEGNVIDYRWGMLDQTVLEPGGETSFDTFFFNPKPFNDYRVFVSN